jgi:peptidyl-prolyl cis-trans isomerase C
MKTLYRLFRSPALHFLFIGALLFALHQGWVAHSLRHSPAVKEELVIGKEQINQIKKDILAQTGFRASPAQLQAAIQKTIDDEILYRQALALHLDRNNPSIRHRLIQLARFVSEDPKASDAVHYRKALDLGLDRSDLVIKRYLISLMSLVVKKVPTPQAPSQVSKLELQDYLEQHPQSFMKPQQVTFTQIYFSRDKRGAQGASQAEALLKQLQKKGMKPDQAHGLGDPFLEGNHFSWFNDSTLQRLFGPIFTRQLAELEPGKWLGPLPSSYGWHLVFIEGTRPAQVPPLAEVVSQVKSAILKEREQQRLIDTLRELRSRYSIRVEDGEGGAYGQT